jgi:hypothetical protein
MNDSASQDQTSATPPSTARMSAFNVTAQLVKGIESHRSESRYADC